MNPYTIGVDLGTSSTRVIAFDLHGHELAVSIQTPTVMNSAPDAIEADPNAVFQSVVAGLTDLAQSGYSPPEAIGGTRQNGGPVAIDAAGNPIGPYESYLDERATVYRDARSNQEKQQARALSGIDPYVMPRILRWKDQDVSRADMAAKGTMLPWWVTWMLSDSSVSELCIDSTSVGLYGGANIKTAQWDEDAVRSWGVSADVLPMIVRPEHIVGKLSQKVSAATRILAGTPLVAGLGDASAGWLGAGAIAPGDPVDTAGTTNHFSVVTDTFFGDLDGALATVPSALEGVFHLLGYTAGAGLSHRWFITNILGDPGLYRTFEELNNAAGKTMRTPSDLLFIPRLGGRVCPTEPEIRGAWIGLKWSHTQAHLYQAILEAVPLEYSLYISRMKNIGLKTKPQRVLGVGGGAKSSVWNQLKSDVLGLEYICSVVPHVTKMAHYRHLSDIYANAIQALRPTFCELRENDSIILGGNEDRKSTRLNSSH